MQVDDVVGDDLVSARRQVQPHRHDDGAGQGCAGGGRDDRRELQGPARSWSRTVGPWASRREQGAWSRADVVVNCAGMWARALGKSVGVDVPLQACEHFYIVTDPMEGMHPNLPVMRDIDHCAYYKEDAGKLLLGAFEPKAKPWSLGRHPRGFRVRRAAGGFRPLPADPGGRHPPRAQPGARRHPEVLQRPGELHGGPALRARPRAGAAELLRRGGLQLHRHPVRRRRGHGAGPLDRGGRAALRPLGGRHPSALFPPEREALPRATRFGGAGPALRHALAVPAIRRPRAACAVPACTTGSLRRGPASARSPAGNGPTGTPPRARRPSTSTLYGRQNWFEASTRRAHGGARGRRPVRPVLASPSSS